VNTGLEATVADRLKAVGSHMGDDEDFLATYSDGLTDAPLADMIKAFRDSRKIALFLSVRPVFKAHLVKSDEAGRLLSIEDMSRSDVRINGGFFVFRREILDWIEPGDELVEETFSRLIERQEVIAYPYEGFFGPMDTLKDRQRLEALHETGRAPWLIDARGDSAG